MEPVQTPRSDREYLGAPGTDIFPLPSWENEYGETCSAWQLSDAERAAIAAGGMIELGVKAAPPPPVGMRVVGPWCEEHQHEQEWSAQLESWTCPVEED